MSLGARGCWDGLLKREFRQDPNTKVARWRVDSHKMSNSRNEVLVHDAFLHPRQPVWQLTIFGTVCTGIYWGRRWQQLYIERQF